MDKHKMLDAVSRQGNAHQHHQEMSLPPTRTAQDSLNTERAGRGQSPGPSLDGGAPAPREAARAHLWTSTGDTEHRPAGEGLGRLLCNSPCSSPGDRPEDSRSGDTAL